MTQLQRQIFGSPASPSWAATLQSFAESIYTNPLNLVLFLVIVYIVVPLIRPASPESSRWTPSVAEARSHLAAPSDRYTYLPPNHPDTVEWTKYTPRTLAVFDGTGATKQSGSRILLAINRKVFDVTKGKNFYGPGGPYGNFAGRDASRGMAKQSFDMEMLTPLDQPIDTLQDLTASEVKNMKEWEAHFTGKYGIVARQIRQIRDNVARAMAEALRALTESPYPKSDRQSSHIQA